MPTSELQTLWVRQLGNVGSEVNGVKNTFSSWDNCMAKTYCKWPVIAAIIVGSLIFLSILFCLVRCLCCGAECCCACFKCCNACCPSPRGGKKSKYADPPSPPQHRIGQPNPYAGYQPTPAPPVYNPQPQFASFDVSSKKGGPHDDALPAMPSWDNASSQRVRNEEAEEHELNQMNPVDEQKAPMLANQAPTPNLRQGEMYSGAGGAAVGAAAVGGMAYGQHHGAHNGNHGYGNAYGQPSPRNAYGGSALGRESPYGNPTIPSSALGRDSPYGNPTIPNPYGSSPLPQQGHPRGPSPVSPQAGYGAPSALLAGSRSPPPLSHNNSYGSQQRGPPSPVAYQRDNPYASQTAYSAYAPSEAGTRYEPNSHYNGQESGTAHNVTTAAPYGGGASAVPQRKPLQDSWRDI